MFTAFYIYCSHIFIDVLTIIMITISPSAISPGNYYISIQQLRLGYDGTANEILTASGVIGPYSSAFGNSHSDGKCS